MFKQHLMRRGRVCGLLVAAAAFPSAAAAMPAPRDTATPPARTAPAGRSTDFQWDDAVIGAAGAVVLVGAGAAATGVARRRRVQGPAVG